MQTIALTDELFQGAVSLARRAATVQPWRLPVELIKLFPPDENLPKKANFPAGVRLRFQTNSPTLAMTMKPSAELRRFDLTTDDGALLQSQALEGQQTRLVLGELPPDQPLNLWLPTTAPVVLRTLAIAQDAYLTCVPDTNPRWLAYGSSITQCRGAHSPARTWPATVARAAGLHLTCLGYGGDCHLDPMVALMMRDTPADFISLKVGINIYGHASLNSRTFRAMLIGFIRIIREKHPTTPMAVISAIVSPPRESTPNPVGFTLAQMRHQVKDAVSRLQAAGDAHVHYFSGLKLLGQGTAERYLTEDLCHPNGDGYEAIGRNFLKHVLSEFELPARTRATVTPF